MQSIGQTKPLPTFIASVAALLLATTSAPAHFVWVAIEQEGDKPAVHVYFGESAASGEAHLIKRISKANVRTRFADGKVEELKTKIVVDGDVASLVAPINMDPPRSVEVDCLYGVFSRGDKPILLHYYAKSLSVESVDSDVLRRAKGLGVDIVPRITPSGLQLSVLRQGKPAVDSEVVVKSPSGEETRLATDESGIVQIKSIVAGRYAIRARVIEDRGGEHDGEKYEEIRHYCTLTLEVPSSLASATQSASAPDGFTLLFNGIDLSGWKGLVGNPKTRAAMSAQELAAAQKTADRTMREHWKVVDGALEFDGGGKNTTLNLCTSEEYGDFELFVDWKILEAGDSGIYLRGSPQVQIWDTDFKDYWVNGADKGSGALWNNKNNTRFPLVKADKPVGQWNTFYIRMVGEKVTVKLNGQLVVNDTVMENFWEREKPIDVRGSIELQNHSNLIWFRNIYLRELDGKVEASIPTHRASRG